MMVEGDVQVASGRRTGCLWKTYSLIMKDVSVDFLFTLCTFFLCTRVGGCGNVYPYTVTDDRLGRNKKRKDNGKRIFPDEIVLGNLVITRFSVHLCQRKFLNKLIFAFQFMISMFSFIRL